MPSVFLSRRTLPAHLRPVFVHRSHGFTYVIVQTGTPQLEGILRMVDLLTVAERDVIRAAYGIGPVPSPITDRALALWGDWVPDALMTVAERRRQCTLLLEQEQAV